MMGDIFIGIPSLGTVDLRAAFSWVAMYRPMNRGMVWRARLDDPKYEKICDKRNYLVEEALKFDNVSHVLFIDDDILFPPAGLNKLLHHDLPIVGGIYALKQEGPPQPLMWRDEGLGIVTKWTPGELIKVFAIGMGFTLIKREVFEKMERPWFFTDIPPFDETEDVYFCKKAKALGIDVYADTDVECIHWDKKRNKGYEVR